MKKLAVALLIVFLASSVATGESYREKRLKRNAGRLIESERSTTKHPRTFRRWRMRQRKIVIYTDSVQNGNKVTEYDYGINQYREYKIRTEVNTDPIPSPLSPIMEGWPTLK